MPRGDRLPPSYRFALETRYVPLRGDISMSLEHKLEKYTYAAIPISSAFLALPS